MKWFGQSAPVLPIRIPSHDTRTMALIEHARGANLIALQLSQAAVAHFIAKASIASNLLRTWHVIGAAA